MHIRSFNAEHLQHVGEQFCTIWLLANGHIVKAGPVKSQDCSLGAASHSRSDKLKRMAHSAACLGSAKASMNTPPMFIAIP